MEKPLVSEHSKAAEGPLDLQNMLVCCQNNFSCSSALAYARSAVRACGSVTFGSMSVMLTAADGRACGRVGRLNHLFSIFFQVGSYRSRTKKQTKQKKISCLNS